MKICITQLDLSRSFNLFKKIYFFLQDQQIEYFFFELVNDVK